MMQFIRKYEWYFYLVLTVVIVISFSFFGTYGANGTPSTWDETAFTTVTGRKVSRGELEEMALFLSSDLQDRRMSGPYMGPNFLNDGVIAIDFLDTKMAIDLILANPELFEEELKAKGRRESGFKSYVHPHSAAVSSEGVWTYFVPDLSRKLEEVRQDKNPFSKEGLQKRIDLLLIERNLPAPLLRHLLMMQEERQPWIEKDEALPTRELALFGYHRTDDWFGPSFTRLVAAFIINAADLAESKGYLVSKEEVEARLLQSSELSFQELKERALIHVKTSQEYLREQLALMHLDFPKAVKIWEKVLLFRRLFHDARNSAWIEKETFAPYLDTLAQKIDGEFYRLPEALAINDLKELAEVETYFDLAYKPTADGIYPPKEIKPIGEIQKSGPELLKKRYNLSIKSVTDRQLASKITLPELLAWQGEGVHFEKLQKEFPELAAKKAGSQEERLSLIDSLPAMSRQKIDRASRLKMIQANPDLIQENLSKAPSQEQTIEIFLSGSKMALPGISDRAAFIQKLDSSNGIVYFEGDGGEHYEITVLDKSSPLELITLKEAREKRLLSPLVDKKMEPFFTKEKGRHPEWKNFKDSISSVMEEFYKSFLTKITQETKKQGISRPIGTAEGNVDLIASMRFAPFVEKVRATNDLAWIRSDTEVALNNQFFLVAQKASLTPREMALLGEEAFSPEKMEALTPGKSSSLALPITGKIAYFVVREKRTEVNSEEEIEPILRLQHFSGLEKGKKLFVEVLKEIAEKNSFPKEAFKASSSK